MPRGDNLTEEDRQRGGENSQDGRQEKDESYASDIRPGGSTGEKGMGSEDMTKEQNEDSYNAGMEEEE